MITDPVGLAMAGRLAQALCRFASGGLSPRRATRLGSTPVSARRPFVSGLGFDQFDPGG